MTAEIDVEVFIDRVNAPDGGLAQEERDIIGRILDPSYVGEGGQLHTPESAYDIVAGVLDPEDFTMPEYQALFGLCRRLVAAGRPITLMTVFDLAKRESGSNEYAKRLIVIATDSTVHAFSGTLLLEANCRDLRKRACDRRFAERLSDAAQDAQNGASATELAERIDRDFGDLDIDRDEGTTVPLGHAVREYWDHLEGQMSGEIPPPPSYGFEGIDDVLGGLPPGHLVVVAGRPGMGKTAFATQVAVNVSRQGKQVALFSLEMSRQTLTGRLLSTDARIPPWALRTKNLRDRQWRALRQAASDATESNIQIGDKSLTLAGIVRQCRKLAARGDLGLVVIDYVGLIEPPQGRDAARTREQEVAKVSRELKKMANQLDVAVVLLSQLNRGVESRNDKRPKLSDLRESGALEQDSDAVLLLYRDSYYNPDTGDKQDAEVEIAKNRHGPCETVKLRFIGEYTRFENRAGTPGRA